VYGLTSRQRFDLSGRGLASARVADVCGLTSRNTSSDSAAEGRLAGERLSDDKLVYFGSALVGEHRLEVVGVP
jgi:hypothetical protein